MERACEDSVVEFYMQRALPLGTDPLSPPLLDRPPVPAASWTDPPPHRARPHPRPFLGLTLCPCPQGLLLRQFHHVP